MHAVFRQVNHIAAGFKSKNDGVGLFVKSVVQTLCTHVGSESLGAISAAPSWKLALPFTGDHFIERRTN